MSIIFEEKHDYTAEKRKNERIMKFLQIQSQCHLEQIHHYQNC